MAASAKSIKKARDGILQAMADLYSVGVKTASLLSVSATAGYKGTEGKAFRTAVKELRDEGIISRHKDEITITEKGIKEEMPEAASAPDNASVQAKLLELIRKEPKGLPNEEKTTQIFDKLCDGKSHTKNSLAVLAGYAKDDSKPFRNLMVRMTRTLKLLVATGKGGRVQLVDRAFPFGRPCDGGGDDEESSASRKRKHSSDHSDASKGKRRLSFMCTEDSKHRR